MADWLQQMESERREWAERAWMLDRDPKFLAWLEAESRRITAEIHGQLELLPTDIGTEPCLTSTR